MKLSVLKQELTQMETVSFILPEGQFVPAHFHVTEVGLVEKKFIDCGGTLRQSASISMQLWEADDFDHRLSAKKLNHILTLAEKQLNLPDLDIEVEYQGSTIGKYNLEFDGINFLLASQTTACLATDQCGIEPSRQSTSAKTEPVSACTPGSGCC